ncbi:uncharacterized protein ACA1_093680 [Acanthamoeba castellanii str. Neff]|uniref:Uncharacterized protein n=1 Tax=Acanthamoeba castellanii (strain ATCC 30010 / Neff) TaxID=1257118 RepID=L8GIK2_ACACF|nr:uncharacterized protein ACA1_093680 [Acanthamoeba castellanii str. Neff]ELR12822.1 hypothetical protein ACA1_093680 [Acanthamoeba castellanii str. Neff]
MGPYSFLNICPSDSPLPLLLAQLDTTILKDTLSALTELNNTQTMKKSYQYLVSLFNRPPPEQLSTQALKEREDLMCKLEQLKAQVENAMLPNPGSDMHVSLMLDGIEHPEHWENQKGEYQMFNVKKGIKEWNEIKTHLQNSLSKILENSFHMVAQVSLQDNCSANQVSS